MKKVVISIVTTLVMAYLGMWIDGFMNTEDSWLFTIIITIITMGSFILYSIEKNNK